MPKKRKLKRVSKGDRRKILAEMKAKGLTAEQAAKKFGVSKWTIYGWRKRTTKGKKGRPSARKTRRPSANTKGATARAIRSEIRAALPDILSKELSRALTTVVGDVMRARRTRARKK